jgi:outer membrane lipase/esterase
MERKMENQHSPTRKLFSVWRCNTFRLVFFTCMPFVASMPAHADLRNVPGINEVEYNLANAIYKVCPELAGMETRNAQQQNLFIACNRMIHTSNALQNSGASDNALNINEDQLRTSLGELAHEEVLTQGTTTKDSSQLQSSNIATRLSSIRTGTAGGRGGLVLNFDGQRLAFDQQTRDSLKQARGGAAGDGNGGLGWFVNGGVSFGDKNATSREDGFDFDSGSVTTGVDWQFPNENLVGFAVGYSELTADVVDTKDVAKFKGYSSSLYGTVYLGTWYFDMVGSYGKNDYKTTRDLTTVTSALNSEEAANLASTLPSLIKGSTDGEYSSVALGFGREFQAHDYSWTPYGRVSWFNSTINGYSEDGSSGLELKVGSQEKYSLEGVLGFDLTKSVSAKDAVLVPQLLVEYHHEFRDDHPVVNARYLFDTTNSTFEAPTDKPDKDYFIIGTGVAILSQGGHQGFLYYETSHDLKNTNSNFILLGYRGEI